MHGCGLGLDVSVSRHTNVSSRVSDHFVSSSLCRRAPCIASPILTSTSCVSEQQSASDFLNELTVHSILSTLICDKWHLQMQTILFLVTLANIDYIANGNEKKTVAQ